MSFHRRDFLQTTAAGMLLPFAASIAAAVQPATKEPAPATPAKPAPAKVDPYSDAVFVAGEPPLPAKDSFTLAILPDTQHYSEKYPEHFLAQTEWIVANRDKRQIAAVLQLGDITNHNTEPEWKNAVAALTKLDGVVPYFLTLGNHDYSEKGACKDRTTFFNKYFDIAKVRKTPNFGGVYDKEPQQLENAYYTFDAGGQKFLVLCLEFGPRADVVRWANEVLLKHPEHATILNTHAYMYFDETRYDWSKYAAKQTWNPHTYAVAKATQDDVSDGEELWQKLVRNNPQVFLTLNGHVLNDGLGRLTSENTRGKQVHQLLVNFQMKPKGGDGWLRLMEFSPSRKTISVVDYSPTREQQNHSTQNKFELAWG